MQIFCCRRKSIPEFYSTFRAQPALIEDVAIIEAFARKLATESGQEIRSRGVLIDVPHGLVLCSMRHGQRGGDEVLKWKWK